MEEHNLIKALAYDGKVRIYTINSTSIVNELQKTHDTWPTASAALGRAVTIGAMMGVMLKDNEKLTIQILGDGPLGKIIVDANANGEVKGFITNPQVHLPLNEAGKLDVSKAIGKGNIYVIKDLGLREPYHGTIPIVSGELAEDFTYYFAYSEQTPSSVGAGVRVAQDNSIIASGGFIIQLLPELTKEEITELEKAVAEIPALSNLIEQGNTPEDIVNKLTNGNYKIIERKEITYKCGCSRDKTENVLLNLGKNELIEMVEEDGKAEVVCQFCRTKYHFKKEELMELLQKI